MLGILIYHCQITNWEKSKKIQDEIQKITDNFIKDVDKIVDAKEKELLTV